MGNEQVTGKWTCHPKGQVTGGVGPLGGVGHQEWGVMGKCRSHLSTS